ncbi:hypothetical protein [Pimelobacter simplex]|uniref:hypothetical protein n=1 Tax=Nocardioides simplex TaxID=2045 RepID=UPI003AB0FD94
MTARSRAAFAPEDVADARRGEPATDLSGWASGAGWEYLGQQVPSGFASVVPVWAEHLFSCARGVLAGDVFAAVMHQLYEVAVSTDGPEMDGAFHDVRSGGTWKWLGTWDNGPRDEPFARDAVWVPATRGAARVPQAALLPRLCLRRSDRLPSLGSRDLADLGLEGFRLAGETDPVLDEIIATWLGGEAGAALRTLPHPFVEVVVAGGHVALVRNGYAAPDEADAFVTALAALARGLRDACAPLAVPAPVGSALPPPAWADPGWTAPGLLDVLSGAWWGAYREAATDLGLTLEDPDAFHRAFPDQPVPGRAQGVLRGRVDGLATEARLAWFADGVAPVDGWVRAALLLPAPAGVPVAATRRGGTLVEETGMWGEVVGDLAACWTVRRLPGTLDAAGVVPAAVATARRLGFVPPGS